MAGIIAILTAVGALVTAIAGFTSARGKAKNDAQVLIDKAQEEIYGNLLETLDRAERRADKADKKAEDLDKRMRALSRRFRALEMNNTECERERKKLEDRVIILNKKLELAGK